MRRSLIDIIERNLHGGWTIYGFVGIRKYYGYTKEEAEKKYRDECKRELVFYNQKS